MLNSLKTEEKKFKIHFFKNQTAEGRHCRRCGERVANGPLQTSERFHQCFHLIHNSISIILPNRSSS